MLYTSTEDGKGAVVAVSIIFMVVGFITTYAISAYHHWCCEFKSRSEWGVQHYVIIDRWFSLGPPVSSTNKTDRHKITEILLKVTLNTIKQTNKQTEVERKNLGFFFFFADFGFRIKKIVSGSVFRYANYTFCHGITPSFQKCSYLYI